MQQLQGLKPQEWLRNRIHRKLYGHIKQIRHRNGLDKGQSNLMKRKPRQDILYSVIKTKQTACMSHETGTTKPKRNIGDNTFADNLKNKHWGGGGGEWK